MSTTIFKSRESLHDFFLTSAFRDYAEDPSSKIKEIAVMEILQTLGSDQCECIENQLFFAPCSRMVKEKILHMITPER